MFVAGAMAATCAASVTNVPALAARLPDGPTHTSTGTSARELCLDDVARGVERAARRVQLDDHGLRALGGRASDAFGQVAGHDLVHDPGRGQDHDATTVLLSPSGARDEEQQAEHDAGVLGGVWRWRGDAGAWDPSGRLSHPAAALQMIEEELAPGLESMVDPPHLRCVREGPFQLVGLADGHGPTVSLRFVDEAEMHPADRRAVVVEEPEWAGVGKPIGVELLAPLAQEPGDRVDVIGMEMTAHTDRPALVQAGVSPCPGPPHEEDGPSVEEGEIRDHLLRGRVLLRIGARSESPARGDEVKEGIHWSDPDAIPEAVVPDHTKKSVARDDEDVLAGRSSVHVLLP